ncbi:MAG: SRPBCC family protein [Cryobacterium sp.]|nr:SRPBCC family protein [Cryobacterium sp.]
MRVERSIPINAGADRVRHIVGPLFGHVSEWATVVAESTVGGEGRHDGAPFTGRACTIAEARFDHLTEEILSYDHRRSSCRSARPAECPPSSTR